MVYLDPESIFSLVRENQPPPHSDGIRLEITISEKYELYAMQKIAEIKDILSLKLDVAPGFETQRGVVIDDELAKISSISNLQRLYVKYMPVNGEFLKHCGNLKKLHTMEFQQCLLEDFFFDYIPSISSLEYLRVCGEKNFRSPRFDNLLKCERLWHFSLDCGDYHDDLISRLPSHPTLTSIDLHGNKLTGKKLEFLKEMHSLKDINLKTNEIDDKGVKYVMKSIPSNLEDLYIGSNQITDAALPIIAENQNIRMLALSYNSGITDKGIQVLGKMQQLRQILFDDTQVTLEGAKKLQQSLTKCYINIGENITLDPPEYPEDYD